MTPVHINVPTPSVACTVENCCPQHTILCVVEVPGKLDRLGDHKNFIAENGREQSTLQLLFVLACPIDEEQGNMPGSPGDSKFDLQSRPAQSSPGRN